jgi:hypothetical protein
MTKNYNSSKSNTSWSIKNEDDVTGDGLDDIDVPDPTKNFNSSKSNTSTKIEGGGGDGEVSGPIGKSKSNIEEDDGIADDPGGGGPGELAMTKNYNSSKSNTSSISVEDDLVGDGGGPGDGSTSAAHEAAHVVQQRAGSGTGVISSTFRFAKTILMAAVLLTAAGVGFDLYHTYNDAIDLNLEDHVTNADFALNGDKTEINGDIGFNIPEMGVFEKKILAQVHVTVLESSPTTDGDYSFEYTLGSGEQTYEFSLTDLDPVTVAKIDAGEDLELEYTTSITVIYLGVELAPATTDMPARIVTVETA